MKKSIVLVISVVFVFILVGCSGVITKGGLLLWDGNVKKISVSSLPKGYNYSFSGKDAEKIIDYLSDLNLIEQFEENPNEYGGMTWVISLEYDDGDALQIYHFSNMFIRAKGGSWYKMTDDEGNGFDNLLNELNN